VAKNFVKEPFVVINADDFYGPGSYRAMAEYLRGEGRGNNSKFCMMGYEVQHTLSDFGSVSRGVCESKDDDFLSSVVERTRIFKDGETIYYLDDYQKQVLLGGKELVSMNIWGFTPGIFDYLENAFTEFIGNNADNPTAEIYIPAVINDLLARDEASVKILPAVDRWFGVTYKEDKALAVENIKGLIGQGVYPDSLWD
jgi:hypothetical protein